MKLSGQTQAPTSYSRENQTLYLMNKTLIVLNEQIKINLYEQNTT